MNLNSNITAICNSTIRVGNCMFSLTASKGTAIPAVATYNTTTTVATLDQPTALSPNTSNTTRTGYTASTSGIQDLAGNRLVGITWSFTNCA